MGYEFTLTLNRKISDDESAALMAAGCAGAAFSTVPYPTGADPDLIVTQLDFDDSDSPNLEVAITVALDAVKVVSDLSVATFSAPAQPNGLPPDEDDDWSDLDAMPTGAPAVVEGTVVPSEEPPGESEPQESAELQDSPQ